MCRTEAIAASRLQQQCYRSPKQGRALRFARKTQTFDQASHFSITTDLPQLISNFPLRNFKLPSPVVQRLRHLRITRRKRWFDSIQDYFLPKRPDTPTDATRLGHSTLSESRRVFAGSIPALGTEKSERGEPATVEGSLQTRNIWGARPTGRRLCCKQKIRVRFPGAPLIESIWLGRQLADHFGLEPEMLWVRFHRATPLTRLGSVQLADHDWLRTRDSCGFESHSSYFFENALAEQRSARLPVTQEIVGSNPIGGAHQYGVVRKPEKRRSSNLRDMSVTTTTSMLFTTSSMSQNAKRTLRSLSR